MTAEPGSRREGRANTAALLSTRARFAIGGPGLAVFGAGIAAVFLLDGNGGAGAAALLAIGALAVVVAALGALPPSMTIGGVAFSLPEKAARLASEADRLGRPDVAEALRVSANLAATAEPFADIYESVRRLFPSDADRTQVLESLFQLVKQRAEQGQWSLEEARRLFGVGRDGA